MSPVKPPAKRTKATAARRRTPRPRAREVEYRAGIHFVDTVVWCDAQHARDVCFVSSVRALATRRHRQIITSATTAALLAPAGQTTVASALVSPYWRRFTLGRLELELFPSGAALGAAGLAIDLEGRRLVYAGEVGVRPSPTAEAGDVRRCDVLVLGARLGRPGTVVPPRAELEASLNQLVERALAAGDTPVVLAEPFADAEDAAVALAARGHMLRAHARIAESIRRYRGAGAKVPAVRKLRGAPRRGPAGSGDVVLWPQGTGEEDAAARAAAFLMHGILRPRLIALSVSAPGTAPGALPGALTEPGVAHLQWSALADHDELLAYVLKTGARQIYLSCAAHENGEALAEELRAQGLDAHVLGPPRQMELFR